MFRRIIPGGFGALGNRICKLPLTAGEVETQISKKHFSDELEVIKTMGELGSEACRIIDKLGVNRTIIKTAMDELRPNRMAQATVCSILRATRYKFFDRAAPGALHSTHCCVCNDGKVDSFEHMLECVGLRNIPKHEEFLGDFLKELAVRASAGNPGYPEKYIASEELCLERYSDSSVDELSF